MPEGLLVRLYLRSRRAAGRVRRRVRAAIAARDSRKRVKLNAIRPLAETDGIAILAAGGLPFLVPSADTLTLSKRMIQTGYTERDFTETVTAILKPGDRVVDVGASWGYFTCIFANLVGPTGRVVSFEPWTEAADYLARNIEGNRFGNVTVRPSALMDEEGVGHIAPRSYRLVLEAPPPGSREITVDTLDGFVRQNGIERIDAIKIDIEGAELRALTGMMATIERDKPALLIEVHPQYLPLYGDSVDDVRAYLSKFGYDLFVAENWLPPEKTFHLIAAERARLVEAGLAAGDAPPRPVFSLGPPDRWHIRSASSVSLSSSVGGLTIASTAAPDSRHYILSDPTPLSRPPADPAARLIPATFTSLSWHGTTSAPLSICVFEYAGQRLVRDRYFPMVASEKICEFRTRPETTTYKVGLRIGGPGDAEIRALNITQYPRSAAV